MYIYITSGGIIPHTGEISVNSREISVSRGTAICEAGEIVNEKGKLYIGPKFLFIPVGNISLY